MFEKIRYFFKKFLKNQKNVYFSGRKKIVKKNFQKNLLEKIALTSQPKLEKLIFLYFLCSTCPPQDVSRKNSHFYKNFLFFYIFLFKIVGWLLEKMTFCAFFDTPSFRVEHLKNMPFWTGPGPPKFPAFAVSCWFSVQGGPKPQSPPKKGCIFQKNVVFISFKRRITIFTKKLSKIPKFQKKLVFHRYTRNISELAKFLKNWQSLLK